MVSSSLSACSKLMVLMSEWSVGSAMTCLSPFRPCNQEASPQEAAPISVSTWMARGAAERVEVVAAFERRDELAAAMLGSAASNSFSVTQAKSGSTSLSCASGSSEMGVEAGRDQDQIRARSRRAPAGCATPKASRKSSPSSPGSSGALTDVADARLVRARRCRERAASDGSSRRTDPCRSRTRPACRCRDARRNRPRRRASAPCLARACSAATATLLNRQKPMARDGSA